MELFPAVIRLKVRNCLTQEPIPNIAVMIKLFAQRKNDYYFLLPLTDKNGKADITKDWLNNKITETRKLFLMDYSSTLESCQPKLELKIMNGEEVKRAIKTMTVFKRALSTKQEDIDVLSEALNSKYLPISKMVELSGDKIIEVLLETTLPE
jgi:hypothetical protein